MTCEKCNSPPKGVTMYEEMEEYRCPYCGQWNKINQ